MQHSPPASTVPPAVPRCVACDYDLTGISPSIDATEGEVQCPECSTRTKPGEYEAASVARSLKGILRACLLRSVVTGAGGTVALCALPFWWHHFDGSKGWWNVAFGFAAPTLLICGAFAVIAGLAIAAFGPLMQLRLSNSLWPLAPTRRTTLRSRALLATVICLAATTAAVLAVLAIIFFVVMK